MGSFGGDPPAPHSVSGSSGIITFVVLPDSVRDALLDLEVVDVLVVPVEGFVVKLSVVRPSPELGVDMT